MWQHRHSLIERHVSTWSKHARAFLFSTTASFSSQIIQLTALFVIFTNQGLVESTILAGLGSQRVRGSRRRADDQNGSRDFLSRASFVKSSTQEWTPERCVSVSAHQCVSVSTAPNNWRGGPREGQATAPSSEPSDACQVENDGGSPLYASNI